jgi:hypothetical protein
MKFVRSWESGKIKALGRQARFVLCTAIYLLEKQGEREPTRARVLKFIKHGGLVSLESLGPDNWTNDEREWVQFFSWCREHAATEGYLSYRGSIDHGIWKLSNKGRAYVENMADKWSVPEQTVETIFDQFCNTCHVMILSKKLIRSIIQVGEIRKKQGLRPSLPESESLS